MPKYEEYAPDGTLLRSEEIPDPPQPDPEPVTPDAVIASIAAMSDDEKAALREALGL